MIAVNLQIPIIYQIPQIIFRETFANFSQLKQNKVGWFMPALPWMRSRNETTKTKTFQTPQIKIRIHIHANGLIQIHQLIGRIYIHASVFTK